MKRPNYKTSFILIIFIEIVFFRVTASLSQHFCIELIFGFVPRIFHGENEIFDFQILVLPRSID